jgi:hypothetical protein
MGKAIRFKEFSMKKFMAELFKNPKSFAQLVSAIIVACSFIFVVIAWLFLRTESLETPLLLFGVSTIVMLVLLAEQQVVLIVSILIIGTIVTKTEFLLKMYALYSGEAQKVEQSFYGETGRSSPDFSQMEMSKRIAELVQRELEKQDAVADRQKLEKMTTKIVQIFDSAEMFRIGEIIDSARTPLDRLATGGSTWSNFVEKYKDRTRFIEDMALLKKEGLITCQKTNFLSCKITETGQGVNKFLAEQRSFRINKSPPVSDDKPIDKPSTANKD